MGPQGPLQQPVSIPQSAPPRRISAWPAILITFAICLSLVFFLSFLSLLSGGGGGGDDVRQDSGSPVTRMCQIAATAQQSQTESELVGYAEDFRQLAQQLPAEDVVWLYQGEQVGAALDGYFYFKGDPELSSGLLPALMGAFQNFSAMCGS